MSKRVALTDEQKIEYMIADLPHQLIKLARKKKVKQKDMAGVLKITPQALNERSGNKENGKPKDAFKYGDLVKLFKFLNLSDDEILSFFEV